MTDPWVRRALIYAPLNTTVDISQIVPAFVVAPALGAAPTALGWSSASRSMSVTLLIVARGVKPELATGETPKPESA